MSSSLSSQFHQHQHQQRTSSYSTREEERTSVTAQASAARASSSLRSGSARHQYGGGGASSDDDASPVGHDPQQQQHPQQRRRSSGSEGADSLRSAIPTTPPYYTATTRASIPRGAIDGPMGMSGMSSGDELFNTMRGDGEGGVISETITAASRPAYHYPGREVPIGRTESLGRADGNAGGEALLFPLADDELASSMTFMRRTPMQQGGGGGGGPHQSKVTGAASSTSTAAGRGHTMTSREQQQQQQQQMGAKGSSASASPAVVNMSAMSQQQTNTTAAATPTSSPQTPHHHHHYQQQQQQQLPFHPQHAGGASPHHNMNTMNSSFFSNASSTNSMFGAAAEAASLAEVGRIHATMKEASAKMDRYIESLQVSLNGKDAELQGLKAQMAQLERNYEYNLDIIRERDEALQSAGVMIEQKHRVLRAAEDKCRRLEERIAEMDRMAKDSSSAAKQREVLLEGEVRAAQRKVEEMELKHQHQLHDRDVRLERERAEMREHHTLRTQAEDEARAAIVNRLEKALADKTATAKQRETQYEKDIDDLRQRHLEAERQITDLTDKLRHSVQDRDTVKDRLASAERNLYESGEQHKAIVAALERRATEAEGLVLSGTKEADAAVRIESSKSAQMAADLASSRATIATLEQRITVLQNQRVADAAGFTTEIERVRTVMTEQIEECEEQRTVALTRTEAAITAEQTMSLNLKEMKRILDEKLLELTDVKTRLVDTERRLAVTAKSSQLLEERLFEAQSSTTTAGDDWRRERMAFEENEKEFGRKWDRLVREQATERERFHQRLSSLQQEFQSLQREFSVSETSRQALQEQLNILDDNANGPRKTIEGLRHHNKELNEKVLQLETANDAIRKQVQLFTDEMHNDPLIKQAKVQSEQIQQLAEQSAALTATVATLQAQLASKEEEIGRYQVDILTTKVEHESELRTAKAESKAKAKEMLSLRGDDKRAMAATLKEHELWHKKALQLEVVVQKMLKERQVMADEVERLGRKLATTTTERNALTDANNMLRVQLEEKYTEQSHATSNARAASVMQQYHSSSNTNTNTAQQQFYADATTMVMPLGNVNVNVPTGGGAMRMGSPSPSGPSAAYQHQQHQHGGAPSPSSFPSAVGAVARDQEAKMNALEQKIQHMRGKTVGNHYSAANGRAASNASRSHSASQPVIRGRSGTAIRHYGYE